MAAAAEETRAPMPTRSWAEILGSAFESRVRNVRLAFPGKVTTFDTGQKTVTVECQIDLGEETPPPIPNVPVVFPGLYWDVQPGTTGWVMVCWRNMQSWLRTGNLLEPEDDGVHDLNSCCFLPGLWPFPVAQTVVLPDGAKVIPLESGLTSLLLASATAAEGLLMGTSFNTHMQTYLSAHKTWVEAVAAAVPVLGPPGNPSSPAGVFLAAISALQAAIAADVSDQVFIPGAGP